MANGVQAKKDMGANTPWYDERRRTTATTDEKTIWQTPSQISLTQQHRVLIE